MKGQLTKLSHLLSSVTVKSAMMLTLATLLVASLSFGVQKLIANNETTAKDCSRDTRYNQNLPTSHPSNLCVEQAETLSWKTWLTGKNRSNQFHFVDLFELLYGHQDKPVNDMSPTNSQLSF